MRTLAVNEFFVTLQGEASFAGTPAVFVRFQGCPVACPWCDTQYAARLLLQMAAHRFAREVLAFQRLHFVTVGIGRFDLPLIQRLLPKALAFEGFSLVSGLPQGGIFCFSGLGGVCGWHTLALFL